MSINILTIGAMLLISMVLLFTVNVAYNLYLRQWFDAYLQGAPVSLYKLIEMTFTRVPAKKLVPAYIAAKNAGLDVVIEDLEFHYTLGGDPEAVVHAMVMAREEGKALSFNNACQDDLSEMPPVPGLAREKLIL
jgi:uncharacterized protein YqfA (UPF0365 family)